MGKSDTKIREDEMWCPECGSPIKKGFFTCSNCKLKVKMTSDLNREKNKKSSSSSRSEKKENNKQKIAPPKKEVKPLKKAAGVVPDKNPLKKSGHPRYWNF